MAHQYSNEEFARAREAVGKPAGALNQGEKDLLGRMVQTVAVLQQLAPQANADQQPQPQQLQQAPPAASRTKPSSFKRKYDGAEGAACDAFLTAYRMWMEANAAATPIEKLCALVQALSGQAELWYNNECRSNQSFRDAVGRKEVEVVLAALLKRFRNTVDDVTMDGMLAVIAQKPGETILAFANRLEAVAARSTNPVATPRLLSAFQRGLVRTELRTQAVSLTAPGNGQCTSLADLVAALARYEAVLPVVVAQGNRPAAMISESTDDGTTATASAAAATSTKPGAPQASADLTALLAAQTALVAALAKASAPRRGIKGECWNCGKMGHRAAGCKSPPAHTGQQQQPPQTGAKQQQQQQGKV